MATFNPELAQKSVAGVTGGAVQDPDYAGLGMDVIDAAGRAYDVQAQKKKDALAAQAELEASGLVGQAINEGLREEERRLQENQIATDFYAKAAEQGFDLFDSEVSPAEQAFLQQNEQFMQNLSQISSPLQRQVRLNTKFQQITATPEFQRASPTVQAKIEELYGKYREREVDPVNKAISDKALSMYGFLTPETISKAARNIKMEADYAYGTKFGSVKAAELANISQQLVAAQVEGMVSKIGQDYALSGFSPNSPEYKQITLGMRDKAVQDLRQRFANLRQSGAVIDATVEAEHVRNLVGTFDAAVKSMETGDFSTRVKQAQEAFNAALELGYGDVIEIFRNDAALNGASVATVAQIAKLTPENFLKMFNLPKEEGAKLLKRFSELQSRIATNTLYEVLPAGHPDRKLLENLSRMLIKNGAPPEAAGSALLYHTDDFSATAVTDEGRRAIAGNPGAAKNLLSRDISTFVSSLPEDSYVDLKTGTVYYVPKTAGAGLNIALGGVAVSMAGDPVNGELSARLRALQAAASSGRNAEVFGQNFIPDIFKELKVPTSPSDLKANND